LTERLCAVAYLPLGQLAHAPPLEILSHHLGHGPPFGSEN